MPFWWRGTLRPDRPLTIDEAREVARNNDGVTHARLGEVKVEAYVPTESYELLLSPHADDDLEAELAGIWDSQGPVSKTLLLASGGAICIDVSVPLEALSAEDRSFVDGLLDQLAMYRYPSSTPHWTIQEEDEHQRRAAEATPTPAPPQPTGVAEEEPAPPPVVAELAPPESDRCAFCYAVLRRKYARVFCSPSCASWHSDTGRVLLAVPVKIVDHVALVVGGCPYAVIERWIIKALDRAGAPPAVETVDAG